MDILENPKSLWRYDVSFYDGAEFSRFVKYAGPMSRQALKSFFFETSFADMPRESKVHKDRMNRVLGTATMFLTMAGDLEYPGRGLDESLVADITEFYTRIGSADTAEVPDIPDITD
jgi:hypothetical protein